MDLISLSSDMYYGLPLFCVKYLSSSSHYGLPLYVLI
jgi:hypothetical protein